MAEFGLGQLNWKGHSFQAKNSLEPKKWKKSSITVLFRALLGYVAYLQEYQFQFFPK